MIKTYGLRADFHSLHFCCSGSCQHSACKQVEPDFMFSTKQSTTELCSLHFCCTYDLKLMGTIQKVHEQQMVLEDSKQTELWMSQ